MALACEPPGLMGANSMLAPFPRPDDITKHFDFVTPLALPCFPAERRHAVMLFAQGLVALRARYGFLLVVDEAHATLVSGQHGGGAAEAVGVSSQIDVHTGNEVTDFSDEFCHVRIAL